MLIYFIQNAEANVVKIGVSVDPEQRLASLQTAHHSPLKLLGSIPGGFSEESELHRRFASFRLHGEWFRCDPWLMSEISLILCPVPKLQGRPIRSVYLAGKITGDSWRENILGGRSWSVQDSSSDWFARSHVPLPNSPFQLDYLGPFFLDFCDGHYISGEHLYGDHFEHGEINTDQDEVRGKSARGVEKADLIFAWIDSLDCYGTIAEIAMAYARVRQSSEPPVIAIALPDLQGPANNLDFLRTRFTELWFVLGMAHILISAKSPYEAWETLWEAGPKEKFEQADYASIITRL